MQLAKEYCAKHGNRMKKGKKHKLYKHLMAKKIHHLLVVTPYCLRVQYCRKSEVIHDRKDYDEHHI